MQKKLAYLGPRGTFCEEAARCCSDVVTWELAPYNSIDAVFAAVQHGQVDRGIVPIENSCEGSVNQTLDLLAYDYDLQIYAEIILPVKHNLLVRPGVKLTDISRILSHPQALAQCRKYLLAHFPDLEYVDLASTAEAARRVASTGQAWAAIGTATAAATYGLEIIAPDVQDRAINETRFIVLAQTSNPQIANAKTSLLLYLLNQPGALYKALEQFYRYDINLTKIESRPAQIRIGDYLFFIDVDGHQSESRIQKALAGLADVTHEVRILGSYPAASAGCRLG